MLDQLTEEKWPQTIKMIIIFSTAVLFVISMFFPASYFYENVKKEVAWGQRLIGDSDFTPVISDVNQNYRSFFVDTGVDGFLRDFYELDANDMANKGGPLYLFASIFRNMAENLNYWFYMIVYRLTLNIYWMPYMLVVTLPSIFAGIMRWNAKRYTFAYSSPFLNRRSMVLIGWGFTVSCCLCSSPFQYRQ
ncbi:DUF4400 domain-containing protein [Providencia heimbachae]|uniref:DUF4400 domain-containing protein n=1 Tax=Providencia heimbachae TaxID=333962 RepID=UPI0020C80086